MVFYKVFSSQQNLDVGVDKFAFCYWISKFKVDFKAISREEK